MSKLSIIIPAYNEEKAIQSIIERVLAAKEAIIREGQIEDAEVIVVNDGSTDATPEIAKPYADEKRIQLISYRKNRGYGAAIKLGFESASGDLVSFLDADGTCDPLFFIQLLKMRKETNSDVVIGSRLNPQSEMPLTRKLGNIFYRELVRIISRTKVTDVASGMRIIRKDSLRKLYPLPNGLQFTPAMSVRAILDEDLKISEVPMPYKERIGRSKLSIFRDGIKFLRIILETAAIYRPLRLFGLAGIVLLIAFCIAGIGSYGIHSWQGGFTPLFLAGLLLFTITAFCGIQCIAAGMIAQVIVNHVRDRKMETAVERSLDSAFFRGMKYIGWLLIVLACALNYGTISRYITSGHSEVHPGYLGMSVALLLIGIQILFLSLIVRVVRLLKKQRESREPSSS